MEKIISSIEKGDLDNLRRLIDEHDLDICQCNENLDDVVFQNKPLQVAVARGKNEIVKFLVDKGATVLGNEVGALRRMFMEFTAFINPFEEGKEYEKVIDFLLPFYVDDLHTSPAQALESVLFNAIHSQSVNAVKLVLDIFRKKHWFPDQSYFNYACYVGNIEILDALLKSSNGFKIDAESLGNACGRCVDIPPDDPRLIHYLFIMGGSKFLFKNGFLKSLECSAERRGLNNIAQGLKRLQTNLDLRSIAKGDLKCIDVMVM